MLPRSDYIPTAWKHLAIIKIQYSLNLPEGVDVGDKPTSKIHRFKINIPTSSNNGHDQDAKEKSSSYYYEALRNALQEAKRQLGDELTVWKDDVGTKELNKELRKGNGEEEEEEGEEGSGWLLSVW